MNDQSSNIADLSHALEEIQKLKNSVSELMRVNEQLAAELNEIRRGYEDPAAAKKRFLANMSHEIRTPANILKGLSELLAMTNLDTAQRGYIQNMISTSKTLTGIINDILDFSKIESNSIEFIEGPYNVSDMLSEISNSVSLKAEEKGLVLLIEASPDMPKVLSGDYIRIRQVITSLLSNAIKYTPSGYVRFILNSVVDGDQCKLVCTVEDTGVGIKAEDIGRLFEAFIKTDLHTAGYTEGTGLGLAISKRLVHAMGGEITVSSNYGAGSRFHFWIPQKLVDGSPIVSVASPASKSVLLIGDRLRMESIPSTLSSIGVPHCGVYSGDSLDELPDCTHCLYDGSLSRHTVYKLHALLPNCSFAALTDMRNAATLQEINDYVLFTPPLITELSEFLNRSGESEIRQLFIPSADPDGYKAENARVLVVDSSEISLTICREMLYSLGAGVDAASGRDEALHLCSGLKYDLILIDCATQDLDGAELIRQLRSGSGQNSGTPLIALTDSYAGDFLARYNIDACLEKPVEFEPLSAAVKKLLPGVLSSEDSAS